MVSYELKRFRTSRCVRILIRPAGVLVTAPTRVSKREIDRFVTSKEAWIQSHLSQLPAEKPPMRPAKRERLRRRSRIVVDTMLGRVNKFYRFSYKRVFIRDVSSRWGSCSESGNLNFSLKACLLPEPLLEYLVTHEVCHLREMNHSERFWALVARTLPDYRERRRKLRSWKEP